MSQVSVGGQAGLHTAHDKLVLDAQVDDGVGFSPLGDAFTDDEPVLDVETGEAALHGRDPGVWKRRAGQSVLAYLGVR